MRCATFNILVCLILFISCSVKGQDYIKVNIPTADDESAYIWTTLQDIPFFEKNNYQVNLPAGTLVADLKSKSKTGELSDDDYERLKIFIRDSIYNRSDYLKGYEKIGDEKALINTMINKIDRSNFNWDFKRFETYQINLTLYGPGGSYDPDEGSILIFTAPEGQFKNYDNPANTIIHEIVHMGVEESIIQKYKVPHPLKERIVDSFVFLNFSAILPEYRIQDMGEFRIDPYLKTKEDLKKLDKFVEQIMGENR
ncbi:hypothetical protein [Flagellimonas sp.]|uniref:hypothetical protein n=1 Tax=Flagellimonas sp. TaxID=2058762 RepID=UPI003B5CBB6A